MTGKKTRLSALLVGAIFFAPVHAEQPVSAWRSPVHVDDPECVERIHIYLDPGHDTHTAESSPAHWGRAEAIETGCPAAPVRPPSSDSRQEIGMQPEPAEVPRAGWAWNAESWREAPGELITCARSAGLDRLFIGVEMDDGAILGADALARFISDSHEAGLDVWAVEGDPAMITMDGLAHAADRARALAAFNTQNRNAPLTRIQYDIEPYLLPEYQAAPASAFSDWASAIRILSAIHGARLDAVVPFWMLEAPGGLDALADAAPVLASITVMSYRTNPEQIVRTSRPLLEWGERQGLPVVIALENGPVADEHIAVFHPTGDGELALASGATGASVIHDPGLSLQAPRRFAYSHSVLAPGSRVSFRGDVDALNAAVLGALPGLAAHTSFAGFALHGLELQPADNARCHD